MSAIRPEQSSSTAVLVEKDGTFFFYQPELGVIASGDSVEGAYEKFVGARSACLRDLNHAGLTISRPVAADPVAIQPTKREIGWELGLFAVKICLVFVLIGAIGAVAANGVSRAVEGAVAAIAPQFEGLGKLSLADVSVKAADIARDAQNLPESQKASLRQSIGIISRELEPLVEAWRNPSGGPGSSSAPGNTGR